MRQHLNTLFVTLDETYLLKDGAAVAVRHEKQTKLRIPLHNLDGIATFGWDIGCSPQLMAACAESGLALTFHNPYGKFQAAVNGFTSGNVLLRRAQYRAADDTEGASLAIAKNLIAAKIANTRTVLQRHLRDHADKTQNAAASTIKTAIAYLDNRLAASRLVTTLDSLRGIEGESAAAYFDVFNHLITTSDTTALGMRGRSRRPPLDPLNALLSFLYSILTHDCRSAAESAGLDSQVGFLHRDRPGRPSLALDLMEEFRPFFADRLALSLLNRKQLTLTDFKTHENGAVLLKDDSRKTVLAAYQERKQQEIRHPFLDEKTTIGLLPHLQARLLARHLRNDLDAYPAFIWK